MYIFYIDASEIGLLCEKESIKLKRCSDVTYEVTTSTLDDFKKEILKRYEIISRLLESKIEYTYDNFSNDLNIISDNSKIGDIIVIKSQEKSTYLYIDKYGLIPLDIRGKNIYLPEEAFDILYTNKITNLDKLKQSYEIFKMHDKPIFVNITMDGITLTSFTHKANNVSGTYVVDFNAKTTDIGYVNKLVVTDVIKNRQLIFDNIKLIK